MIYRAEGRGIREMARLLHRSPSTISQELSRNGSRRNYSARLAQACYKNRKHQKIPLLQQRPRLASYVAEKLRRCWSPQQISHRLKQRLGAQSMYTVSHETIYASIYALPRGELRTDLIKALGQSHKTRRPRSRGSDRRGQIPDLVPISQRPLEVQDRQMPGHWEGDLIKGKGNRSAVGTLVERTSRFLIMVQLEDATAPVVTGGFTRELSSLPHSVRQTLTYDRGKEMSMHLNLAKALNIDVYFADPHSPWQRGTNENTNGLIRQFLPKGTDRSQYSQQDLNNIADLLNGRPRACLNYQTPKEVFYKILNNAIKNQNVALLT